ncbi:hypothetical protein [Streptomyces sp. NPDC018045]|uniref:hypothetical protein n=1 Tax=Streptomyces sp. NPDC018045 TaxID=3365037 RepID=UPI00379A0F26
MERDGCDVVGQLCGATVAAMSGQRSRTLPPAAGSSQARSAISPASTAASPEGSRPSRFFGRPSASLCSVADSSASVRGLCVSCGQGVGAEVAARDDAGALSFGCLAEAGRPLDRVLFQQQRIPVVAST